MTQQSEIVDLSPLANIQKLEAIEKLLEESEFSKFTLILTRKEKRSDQPPSITTGGHHRRRTKYSINTNSKNSRYGHQRNSKYSIPNKEEADFDEEELGSTFQIALGYYNREFYQNALVILNEQQKRLAESLKQSAKKDKQYQSICFYIGNCHYRLKRYEQAIQYYAKKFQDEQIKQLGQKLNNMGSCYAKLDQLRLSLNYYADAYKIYQKIPEFDSSNLLNNIGVLYAQSSMFQTAQKYFIQSIQERKLKSPENYYLLYCSYYQLGNCQKNAKKFTQATSSFFNALQIAERGIGDESEILVQLAGIYQKCEKWSQALDCYEKLSMKTINKGFIYEKAAQLHRNMGHLSDYDRFIKKAYEEYGKQSNQRKLSELHSIVSRLSIK